MTEDERLLLILIKQDFPNMNESDLSGISRPQKTGYLSSVRRFIKLAKLFGYEPPKQEPPIMTEAK